MIRDESFVGAVGEIGWSLITRRYLLSGEINGLIDLVASDLALQPLWLEAPWFRLGPLARFRARRADLADRRNNRHEHGRFRVGWLDTNIVIISPRSTPETPSPPPPRTPEQAPR
jgi:hypothetical protein